MAASSVFEKKARKKKHASSLQFWKNCCFAFVYGVERLILQPSDKFIELQ